MAIPEDKLKKLEETLRADKTRLEEKIKVLKDNDFGDAPGRDNEEADETEELSNKLGAIDMLQKRLGDIEDALDKISDGEYGKCEKCGQEIENQLLEADPESRLCKSCKA